MAGLKSLLARLRTPEPLQARESAVVKRSVIRAAVIVVSAWCLFTVLSYAFLTSIPLDIRLAFVAIAGIIILINGVIWLLSRGRFEWLASALVILTSLSAISFVMVTFELRDAQLATTYLVFVILFAGAAYPRHIFALLSIGLLAWPFLLIAVFPTSLVPRNILLGPFPLLFVAATATFFFRVLFESGLAETQRKLDESQKSLSGILESVGGIAFRGPVLPQRPLDYVSSSITSLTGIEASAFLPDADRRYTLMDLIHPDDRDQIETLIRQVAESRQSYRWQYRLQTPDGNTLWVEETGRIEPVGAKGTLCIKGFITDATSRQEAQMALKTSEEIYRAIFLGAGIPIARISIQGRIEEINDAFSRLMEYSSTELSDTLFQSLTHHQDIEMNLSYFKRVVKGELDGYQIEKRFFTKSGRLIWALLNVSAVKDDDDKPAFLIAMMEDITLRKQAEEMIERSEEYYRALIEHSSDALTILNTDFTVGYEGPSNVHILGYRQGEMVSREIFDFIHEDDREILHHALTSLIHDPSDIQDLELRFYHRAGHYINLQVKGKNLLGHTSVRGLVLNAWDISEQKRIEQQLQHENLHDSLTQLPNRALFLDRLDQEIKRSLHDTNHRFAVLFVDLDRFKLINDSLGHIVGDQLIVAIGHRMRACIKETDTLSRFGGDEFTILLTDLESEETALLVANRIQDQLSQPFKIAGREIFTSASIGITLNRDEVMQTSEDVLRDADTAMYRAKVAGKARYMVFDENMHQESVNKLQLEMDLRRAIQRDEFDLHYQPVLDLQSARIKSFEGLLRWRHPSRDLVMPGRFIPYAEETGLIVSIGRDLLLQACMDCKRWNEGREGDDRVEVNVNVSARQVQKAGLVDDIIEALNTSGLAPELLNVEITESTFMDNMDMVREILQELSKLNIRLYIDDFGTGYSSLSYLDSFPIEGLKIDRSFVMRLRKEGGDPAIVKAVMDLSRNLALRTVAEGVEEVHQLEALMDLRCDFVQGFLFSKAVPFPEVAHLLKDRENAIISESLGHLASRSMQ